MRYQARYGAGVRTAMAMALLLAATRLVVAAPGGLITLELQPSAELENGTFHPTAARIVDVQTWAAPPSWRADAAGFHANANGQPAAKPRAKRRPAAKVRAARGLLHPQVLVTLQPEGDAVLQVDTEEGQAAIAVKDIGIGSKAYLNGQLQVRRLPAATRLTDGPQDYDYPSLARGADGVTWLAYVAYQRGGEPDMQAAAARDFRTLVPNGNGDRIWLRRFDGGQWAEPLPVTDERVDVWKPTVAVDATGKVWVAWAQNVNGNWDIYRRRYDPPLRQWSAIERVTTDPGTDFNVVSTTDSAGNVWWAWQGRRGRFFQIFLISAAMQDPVAVTGEAVNHWAPAIAADRRGGVYVAWDSYQNGNYDVFLQRFQGTQPDPVVPVATTSNFEVRPSLAVGPQGHVWIAYEEGGPNWGKDYGRMVPQSAGFPSVKGRPAQDDYNAGAGRSGEGGDRVGIPLYKGRHIVVKCLHEGRLQQPADPMAAAGDLPHPKSFARLAAADDGHLWLLFRHHPLPSGARETWAEYAMQFDGRQWTAPVMLADSDAILDNRPAILPHVAGGALAVYASDWRLRGANNNARENNARVPLKSDLYAAMLFPAGASFAPQLAPVAAVPKPVAAVHPAEAQDIERMRAQRVESAGKTYQLARGEFHRHTEYTAHRDGDGALEDMYRYGIDAADMDWIGNGDHDNGFGHQYPWWTIQKAADVYHNPPWFIAPYTYERSEAYPNGHRNVIFAQRGIRTLPRGDMQGDEAHGTPDTKMLYAYLKQFHGMCASHTSATNMGTDWRDNDPLVEPVVEIYQGDRNNYECEAAPRGIAEARKDPQIPINEQIHPQGYVWNALAKGYRLGFESSSDHISTHSSYAVLLVEKPGREAIVEAFRARRCYAATDNIVLTLRCNGHLMGEEFTLSGRPTLAIHAAGTGPIARLDIVRNAQYVYSTQPNTATLDLQWTDADPPAGKVNYYYVRLQQADTNLAWSSPVWIRRD